MDYSQFNFTEIFEIAQKIERHGAKFYRDAAAKFNDDKQDIKKLLLEFAEQEDSHEETFTKIQANYENKGLGNIELMDPLSLQYLDAIAKDFVFHDNEQQYSHVLLAMDKQDVFKFAIQREKDSILFYLGIKNSIRDKNLINTVDTLMKAEQKHLVDLTKYAKTYKYSIS